MANRMTALGSAHQIGLSTCMEDVLIVVGGSSSLHLKQQRNWSHFNLYLYNQRRYRKADGGVGFSALNRFIYVLGRRSNCSWGFFIAGLLKTAKSEPISLISPQPRALWQNG